MSMGSASKRIPVKKDTWKSLGELKGAGETYDDVLTTLIQEHNQKVLAEKFRETEEMDRDDLIKLE